MTKNIIAQTRASVQLRAQPINRMRQLRQLSRLAPELYERITGNMRHFPGLDYSRHIAEAMKQVLRPQGEQNGHEDRSNLVNVAQPNGNCATEIVQVTGADRPFDTPDGRQDRPLYDLVIASKKYGYGSTTNANAPIEWWKLAGGEKEAPPRQVSLADPVIQKHLEAYELVDTEIQTTRIIRKYRTLRVGAP